MASLPVPLLRGLVSKVFVRIGLARCGRTRLGRVRNLGERASRRSRLDEDLNCTDASGLRAFVRRDVDHGLTAIFRGNVERRVFHWRLRGIESCDDVITCNEVDRL